MIEQASEQITQMFLSDKIDSNKSAQAWELIELLSTNPVIQFHDSRFWCGFEQWLVNDFTEWND
ncbi:hypothetical protein NE704_15540, partial [[Ruminococcus] gnavus]|nr:hypothetical protein [Mediterraneibacter gnavus]